MRDVTVRVRAKGLFGLVRGVTSSEGAYASVKCVPRQLTGPVVAILVAAGAVAALRFHRYLVVRVAAWPAVARHLAVGQGAVVEWPCATRLVGVRGPVPRPVVDRKRFRLLVCGLLFVALKMAAPLAVVAPVLGPPRAVGRPFVGDIAASKSRYN